MPIKYKQEDGTEIEVYTAEEVEAAKTAAIEESKPVPPEVPNTPPAPEGTVDVRELASSVNDLKRQLADERIGKYASTYAGDDAEKQSAYKTAFGRLTGYEDNADGQQARAADAARLAFGNDATVFDVTRVSPTTTGAAAPGTPAATEADSVVRKALNITPEMVKEYGPGGTKNPGASTS